ncbi:MAG: barstar family protein [Gemmataceae bacterium]
MREFVLDLTNVSTFEGFVAAFNDGFCQHCGGHWHGRSWDAFHDYLSWPQQQQYRLVFEGWAGCRGLQGDDRRLVREILADNPHVEAILAAPETSGEPPR